MAKKNHREQVTVILTRDLLREVVSHAKRESRSKANWIRLAITEKIERTRSEAA